MEPPQVHLSDWFEKGFQQYKENISIVIPASFIALILSVCSAGILAGPMLSGILIITLGLLDGREPKPRVSDLFKGFRFFLHSLLFVVLWGIVVSAGTLFLLSLPGVGQLAALFFVYAAQAFLMFGPFLIVDRNMDFRSASVVAFQTVKGNFWSFLERVGRCKRRRQYRDYPVRDRRYPDGPPADLYSHRCLSSCFWCCKRREWISRECPLISLRRLFPAWVKPS